MSKFNKAGLFARNGDLLVTFPLDGLTVVRGHAGIIRRFAYHHSALGPLICPSNPI
jgi:hypothetical protein